MQQHQLLHNKTRYGVINVHIDSEKTKIQHGKKLTKKKNLGSQSLTYNRRLVISDFIIPASGFIFHNASLYLSNNMLVRLNGITS